MKIKKIKVYEFDELEDNVKEKVLQEFRDNENFFFLEMDIKEEMEYHFKENKTINAFQFMSCQFINKITIDDNFQNSNQS